MSAIHFVNVAPVAIPAILLPAADKPAADYYNEQRSNPDFVRALVDLNAKIKAGAQVLATGIADETLALLKAELEAAAALTEPEMSDEQAEALLKDGYAIPMNGAFTTVMAEGGITLFYGAVGPIRTGLPSMAAARYIVKNTKRLPFTWQGKEPKLTPASLAHLENLAATLPAM